MTTITEKTKRNETKGGNLLKYFNYFLLLCVRFYFIEKERTSSLVFVKRNVTANEYQPHSVN